MQPRSESDRHGSVLAADVSFLGRVLGEVLHEQGGEALFEAVESLRLACRVRRQQPSERADEEIERLVAELPLSQARDVVRAFTMYFHLINMAEENHRLRRIAERAIESEPAPRDESIGAAIRALHDSGASEAGVRELLAGLSIRPVITAHPTEARRMTVLRQLRHIYSLVEELSRGQLDPTTRERTVEHLYAAVTNLWQSDELRVRRQTVMDEVRNGLYYFDESIFDVVAGIYRDLDEALRRDYPGLAGKTFVFLTFGSWIGGDRDGNPNVTPEVVEETLRMHKTLVLTRYRAVTSALFDALTPSSSRSEISDELARSLARDAAEFGGTGREIEGQWQDEPYRRKLAYIGRRLESTYRRNGVAWRG
ncbi:MAG TPA: phosphoenolpyruvate carboxylase, partial [Chloroflexota bacterium]|nr:phosphoenolpyruvate carboxylase [Chloroflexota bacterium]